MKLKLFIDRPILACVVSVLILLVAETVQKSVVVPLEEAINGVEDMLYMTSTSTNTGSGSITVYFKQGTDPDMATINTKNRVSEAEGLLPAEVTKIGVTVEKRQSSMLKIIALYSPDDSYDQTFINNYFKINIEPRLSRVSGVGNVNVMGGDYAMRIWLDPQRMAQYNLVPDDVTAVLDEQNVEAATGTLGEDSENTFQYTLKYRGRYETAEGFGNIVVKAFNALTTCPALCALIMTPHMDKKTGEKLSFSSRFHHAFEAAFNQLVYKYKGGVKWFFRRKWLIGVGIAAAVALLVVLMRSTKTGLVPDEDMGTVFVNVTTPPGSSLHQTIKAMEEVEACIKDIPQIERYSNVSGYSMMGGQAPSGGMLIIKLKNWSERPGLHHVGHQRDIPPDGERPQRQALRLRPAHHHGILHRQRRGTLRAGPRRRLDRDAEGAYGQVHSRPQRPSGGADGLYDVRHQVPAISGRSGCRSTFCPAVPTCARLRQT